MVESRFEKLRYMLSFEFDVFSIVAIIIALLSLWYSHLRGPDIQFCPIREAQLQEWSTDRLEQWLQNNYVPRYLDIQPIDLVFINSGQRAGVITEIMSSFEPAETFLPFFRNIRVTPYGNQYGKGLPVSIREGDACVINLSVSIEIINWGDEFRHSEVEDLEHLGKAFSKSVELDKIQLEGFVNFLKNKKTLGMLHVSMEYSTKGGFKTRRIASIQLKNGSESVTKGFQKLLENWDTTSALNKLLGKLPDLPNQIINRLTTNLGRMRDGQKGNYDDLRSYLSKIDDSIVFEREKSLKRELKELSEQIQNYNRIGELISKVGEKPTNEQIALVNREEKSVLKRTEYVLSELKKVRERLIKEIQ